MIVTDFQQETVAGLSSGQRAQLAELLGVIARTQGLTPGIHPGHPLLGRADEA
jgi:hypothetical protein